MEKRRKCLKCGKKFRSISSGNRICQRCKGSDAQSAFSAMPAALRKTVKKTARAKTGANHWKPLKFRDNPRFLD